jgi:hypothetical protein
LVRRLDTPAAAKGKFSDLVADECQAGFEPAVAIAAT